MPTILRSTNTGIHISQWEKQNKPGHSTIPSNVSSDQQNNPSIVTGFNVQRPKSTYVLQQHKPSVASNTLGGSTVRPDLTVTQGAASFVGYSVNQQVFTPPTQQNPSNSVNYVAVKADDGSYHIVQQENLQKLGLLASSASVAPPQQAIKPLAQASVSAQQQTSYVVQPQSSVVTQQTIVQPVQRVGGGQCETVQVVQQQPHIIHQHRHIQPRTNLHHIVHNRTLVQTVPSVQNQNVYFKGTTVLGPDNVVTNSSSPLNQKSLFRPQNASTLNKSKKLINYSKQRCGFQRIRLTGDSNSDHSGVKNIATKRKMFMGKPRQHFIKKQKPTEVIRVQPFLPDRSDEVAQHIFALKNLKQVNRLGPQATQVRTVSHSNTSIFNRKESKENIRMDHICKFRLKICKTLHLITREILLCIFMDK